MFQVEPQVVDWGYAISTLVIRFVGIFVVLGVLQIVMQVTGRIFSLLDTRKQSKKLQSRPSPKTLTREEAAAVGMALYMYDKTD